MVFCNEYGVYEPIKAIDSHNPYFNRWFSAIMSNNNLFEIIVLSQSLF